MKFLVTGTAGFIGFHLARRLLEAGQTVVGIDGMTPYYDVSLKVARQDILQRSGDFTPNLLMLEEADEVHRVVSDAAADVVIHLAAQAGVRYSLEQPRAYLSANLVGGFNLLEAVRQTGAKHFMLASTSSVYGANNIMPFRETDRTDHPLTLYAATKKSLEDMAHSYSHLWKIPTTGLRFFTVYGPWGRPDMALFKFVRAALAGEPIEVYGHGRMRRDFTYVDDLVEAIVRLVDCPPAIDRPVDAIDSLSPAAPYRIVNIGGGSPVGLTEFIDAIEVALGVAIERRMLTMQTGDVPATWASPDLLRALTGYTPSTGIGQGIGAFVSWYKQYYKA